MELEENFASTQKHVICLRKSRSKALEEAENETRKDKTDAIEKAQRIRKLEEISFRQEANYLNSILDESPGTNTTEGVKLAQRNFEILFEKCRAAHHVLIRLLDKETALPQMDWIEPIQKIYRQINMMIGAFIQSRSKSDGHSNSSSKASGLRLERIRMPRFEGGIRDYPRFKDDFKKQVMPEMQNSQSAAYALRSCLCKNELSIVKGAGDDVEEMWEKLDEEYGDPAIVADTIIDEIKRFKPIADKDHRKFIEFFGVIEEGYRDLERLSMRREITTTSSVSVIEKRLPPSIRVRWSEVVCREDSDVDKTDKFLHLLKFLLEKKKAIKYDLSDLRRSSTGTTRQPAVNLATRETDQDDTRAGSDKKSWKGCWLHNSEGQKISDCRRYLSMSSEDKVKLLKENRACWSCLGLGHRSSSCRARRVCGEDGCARFHHKSFHAADVEGVSFHSLAGAPRVSSDHPCLLQLMRIKTRRAWANTLWDCGATMSFITFKKARAENLKGIPIRLSVTKVGGDVKDINSNKYELPLIDTAGNTVYFEVYCIERITADITAVDLDGVIHLFDHTGKDEVRRPMGEVEVLIGYEYAGRHPVKEQAVGHLLLLGNRFGKCLGGSHPDIHETTQKMAKNAVLVHHVAGVKVEDFYRSKQWAWNAHRNVEGADAVAAQLAVKTTP